MEPLVTLVTVAGLLLLAGALGAVRFRRPAAALRGGLAAMFALTGGAHFVGMREEIVAMVPSVLPAPELLVTLTGIAELACATGLLWSRTARGSAAALSALLVVMFPANVYAAGGDVPWWDRLGPRTVLQSVFLAATVSVLVRHGRSVRTAPDGGASPRPGTLPGRQTGSLGLQGGGERDPGDMEIEILVVPDCPHKRLAEQRLRQALRDAGLPAGAFTTRVVADQAEAERSGFTGSPTVLVNGRDPFTEPGATPSLACRIYRTPAGVDGAPDADQLRRAIEAAPLDGD
ncbi:hypothetical protein [Streptomyces sp. NPDC002587]